MATFTARCSRTSTCPRAPPRCTPSCRSPAPMPGAPDQSGTGQAAEIILIDTSGSMDMPSAKIAAARRAAQVALDEIIDGTLFAVVAGNTGSQMVYPYQPELATMTPQTAGRGEADRRRGPDVGGDGDRSVDQLDPRAVPHPPRRSATPSC